MSFICNKASHVGQSGWEVGYHTGADKEHFVTVETVSTQEEAFRLCNYLNGGVPMEAMNILQRLTGLKLVSKSKGGK